LESLQLLLAKLSILLISTALAVSTGTYTVYPPTALKTQTVATAGLWDGYPELERACSCESWGDPNKEPREFDDNGSVLSGYPHAADIGACQINTDVWASKAAALRDDLNTLQGNVDFAKWLYSEQGMKPWTASAQCWQSKTAL
jgi:hypothetical protein